MAVEKTWRPTSRNQTDPVPRSSLLTSYWYYNKALVLIESMDSKNPFFQFQLEGWFYQKRSHMMCMESP